MGPERRPKQPKDDLKPRKSGSRKGIVDMTQLPSDKTPPISEAKIEEIKRLIEIAGKSSDKRYKRP